MHARQNLVFYRDRSVGESPAVRYLAGWIVKIVDNFILVTLAGFRSGLVSSQIRLDEAI